MGCLRASLLLLLAAFTGSGADDLKTTLQVSKDGKVYSEIVPTPVVLVTGPKLHMCVPP